MAGTGKWIVGGLVGLIGVFGLFAAAHAVDPGFYLFGLLLFAFAVLFVFAQIRSAFDQAEAETGAGGGQAGDDARPT